MTKKVRGIKNSTAIIAPPTKQQQEFDRTRITISFGILSFHLAIMLFLMDADKFSSISVLFNGFFRFIVAYSIFVLFLFILCTASFYRSERKGILDFLRVDQAKKDLLFGEAIEWSFVAATMVGVSYVIEMPAKLIDVSKCGEEWWSLGICYSGIVSAIFIGYLVFRAFIRSLHA